MNLIDRYVTDLYNYTVENNLVENYFTYATIIIRGSGGYNLPDELDSFLKLLSPEDTEAVLIKFIDIAREHLGLLDVRIFSAVQLTVAQRAKIEKKLIEIFGKEISMILKVDRSLIGGLRIIVGNTVFDNTIKTKLAEIKKNVYKEVYLKQ